MVQNYWFLVIALFFFKIFKIFFDLITAVTVQIKSEKKKKNEWKKKNCRYLLMFLKTYQISFFFCNLQKELYFAIVFTKSNFFKKVKLVEKQKGKLFFLFFNSTVITIVYTIDIFNDAVGLLIRNLKFVLFNFDSTIFYCFLKW